MNSDSQSSPRQDIGIGPLLKLDPVHFSAGCHLCVGAGDYSSV